MLILNIDTAIDKGSFCISNGLDIIAFEQNERRHEQAGWLHEAIHTTFQNAGIEIKDLDAIAVSNGPGSYTGLRIGLASAKGFCYALKKPLICVSTLQVLASAVQPFAKDLICPMIDARRMEVFTAVFDTGLKFREEPFATVLDERSFTSMLTSHHVLFTGNGAQKFTPFVNGKGNVEIRQQDIDARSMVPLSAKMFEEKNFSNVAYSEPYYVKDVYISKNKNI